MRLPTAYYHAFIVVCQQIAHTLHRHSFFPFHATPCRHRYRRLANSLVRPRSRRRESSAGEAQARQPQALPSKKRHPLPGLQYVREGRVFLFMASILAMEKSERADMLLSGRRYSPVKVPPLLCQTADFFVAPFSSSTSVHRNADAGPCESHARANWI